VGNAISLAGLAFFQGRWHLYHGMGNSHIGLATAEP
jgi:hypothetical protein